MLFELILLLLFHLLFFLHLIREGFDKYKKDLITLGTKSGRDVDKISLTGLNPFFLYDSVTFKEAKITLICKKIYYQDMDLEVIEKNLTSDIYDRFYGDDPIHRMYIGEVIDIIKND